MERTPNGTAVGVDDPYAYGGPCDHLTSEGKCRLAHDRPGVDPEFTRERRANGYACVAADGDSEWQDCTHYQSRSTERECERCGLRAKPMAHGTERPLLEEHHLSYADSDRSAHEITVFLCRWCHAKVHGSWARINDDVNPTPEALAAREARRSREQQELEFRSAADREPPE